MIPLICLIFSLNLFSKETISIKGKLFFSQDFYWTFSNLLVKIENSDEYIKIKENGKFEIITSSKKENYKISFYYGSLKFKEFIYKYEWTKRDKPKSISLAEKCEVNKSIVHKEFKEKKEFKLFIHNWLDSLILSKKDLKLQNKLNINYIKIDINDINKFECYLNYNRRVFKYLYVTGFKKDLDKLHKNVIGYKYRYHLNDN